ncbi:M48 family metallopeptidase [Metallumcola ferriviriculae]|uniref:M48 family metallopeptidase n=1 Tax=Metallumcola ferriviriculae TaxID=3039180 RepID=A0AAU0UVQ1_9FIRM|nr:M48 family metallopeptidase [Desulfitibacteraceae bacterium MK1]
MNSIMISNIAIEVIRKKIKNINLSVHPPDGRVRLAVPEKMDEEAIKLFAISKLSWIKKQRGKFDLQDRQSIRKFLSGESHYFFGTRYLLNVVETSGKQHVELRNKKYIDLYIRPNSTKEKREKVMTAWYREQLKSIIPEYIIKWEEVIGVSVKDWGVKLMKTRWGTCNTMAQRIWLNLELAKTNPRCLEFIIVHEMVHLLERSHNDRFKAYMDKFLPNWRSIRDELNGLIYESSKWS